MRKFRRFTLALVASVALHAAFVGADPVHETAPRAPRLLPAYVDLRSADELLVVCEEPEPESDRPVEESIGCADDAVEFADFEVSDCCELASADDDPVIGLGDADAPFEGAGVNGTIGIGGGAGGAFGGRRGGHRNLRAGGGGKAAGDGWSGDTTLQLVAKRAGGEVLGTFPLRRSDVRAEASGWIASTHLTQTFENAFDEPVEAVYVFPLPSDAAVNEFELVVAGRRVVGVVRPREEAEAIYAQARADGMTASLLTQERPNVFTQSVANIAPHESVQVAVTFFHGLRYDAGMTEYVLPTCVAPRYVPGAPVAEERRAQDTAEVAGGGGTANATDAVPDASRISPPLVPPGMRSGHELSLELAIDAGVAIERVESPTHEIDVRLDGRRASVRLAAREVIPDRDVVVRWRVGAAALRTGCVAHRDATQGGWFSAFVVPPLELEGVDVGARELTFVLDTSGSMGGVPIETSKQLVARALRGVRPYDRFNVIQFAGGTGSFASEPVDATPENVAAALAYVETLRGSGGTEMLAGIRAWLAQPADPRRIRTVVFLTDGFVGNEEQILATIRGAGQDARWFAFGIGSSVNRHLIEGIAEQGRGACEVVIPQEGGSAEAAADRLLARFDAPLLLNATLDTNGLPVQDLQPARVPDLFAGAPLVVTARYSAACRGELLLRGSVGGRDVVVPIPVDLPEAEERNAALAAVWARHRVHDLDDALLGAADTERAGLLAQIEALGLEFRLVTRRTSFVAVDETRRVGDGFPLRLLQPSEIPDGVRYWGVVGAPVGAEGLRVEAWGLTVADARGGEVMVAQVDRPSAAQRAGLYRGFVIETVGGHAVRDVRHLRALLLATDGPQVTFGYRNGAGEAVRDTTLTR